MMSHPARDCVLRTIDCVVPPGESGSGLPGGIVIRCKVAHLLHSWHSELPGLCQLPFAAQVGYCRSLGVLPVFLLPPGFRICPD